MNDHAGQSAGRQVIERRFMDLNCQVGVFDNRRSLYRCSQLHLVCLQGDHADRAGGRDELEQLGKQVPSDERLSKLVSKCAVRLSQTPTDFFV